MTTMLEVAKRAGVSKATVSRVLSGNGYVSQETKDRVFQAVAESGYRPNLLARSLAAKTTQTLGLVVTNTLYHGVYFSELLFHTARMAEDKGRQLLLADGKHSAQEERQAIQYLLDLRCDAIMIYPRFLSVDEIDKIIDSHPQPIMVLNRRLRKNSSHCVWCDHRQTSENAVSELIAAGHRQIAFITGSMDSPTGVERLSGYKDALTRHGIAIDENLIVRGKWTPACGAAGVETLLARGAAFSALVASNDDMAIGAIKQLHDRGVAVPSQVSVIGFDDIALAPYTVPALSSVRIPVTDMIKETIGRLIFMLDGGAFTPPKTFTGSLIRRASVAPLPSSL
ncbi:LacI family DNA-binding transcriptional regulator [Citrobacter rodentium]|uniref:Cryptic asc operon repressor n=2 Tax=Citrobacter rodentium TaxID=67825 RepID=D2TLE4_CITRI|nr:LacI family DNA-binding transcriptional regulator [Citrobacter rodentium]KIQ48896.1 transcriptional regulator [Citrobacter rodentium]QBY29528.1 LacI family DNA-binding transcriptional regulator [Citrobacter rodentium]UHO33077.1 LacI family DNA-binding transcriptional regulator [Citrobacter rodentium NBRC 105723 = DSM 16636]CBG89829.1 cryptic asc operon repressor [Citrobacter rodentium ICC168]HAT8012570.1 transcriptional regulator [Citrobacter rodentium NBRC 105723 = DSM 16636]